jgi:hypothetical protein
LVVKQLLHMDLKPPLPIPHPSRRNRAARHRVRQQELIFAEVLLLRSHIVLPSWVLIICSVRHIRKGWLRYVFDTRLLLH